MSAPLELSSEADKTRRLLMLIAADWDRSGRIEMYNSLRGGSQSMSMATATLPTLMQIGRCVSVAELFTYERIMEVIDRHVDEAGNPMLSRLYKEKRKSVDSSWASIENSAREWLSVDLASVARHSELMAYVDVRNSAMHGNGSLTKRQERNRPEVASRLRRVGITIEVNYLVVPADRVRHAALVCAAFVQGVDRLTWSPPSRFTQSL